MSSVLLLGGELESALGAVELLPAGRVATVTADSRRALSALRYDYFFTDCLYRRRSALGADVSLPFTQQLSSEK